MNDCVTRELALTVPDDGAGTRLTALVHVPRDVAAGRRRAPLAVCCHGMGESALRVAPLARRLGEAGAVVVSPSFRGGGADGAGPTTTMSVLTEMADVGAVLDAARAWPFVDASRTALLGRSLGGLVAALAASRRRTEIAALALWYPALGSPGAQRSRFRTRQAVPASYMIEVDGRPVPLGARYALDVWDLDVDAELRRLRVPVLIVHGDADRAVPLEVSRHALRVLPDARLEVLPGAGHGFGGEHWENAVGATTGFLSWVGALGE